ncbi:MAG: glycosyltransferase family 4 protein [Acholeplasmataceae bacterium]|nr:glycosyltransferase family 4 protein [Acholeplasmataceae bacterium]
MKLLFIRSNSVNPDSRVEKEVNSLLKAGHSIIILAWDRSSDHKMEETEMKLENGTAIIYRIGIKSSYGGGMKKNFKPLLRFQFSIIKFIFKYKDKIDAIHACDFDTAFSSVFAKFLYRKKFVYDIFDYYIDAFGVPKNIKPIVLGIDRFIIGHADATIICSEQRLLQIKGTTPKKLVVIHNSPEQIESMNVFFNLNPQKIKIVYVGILGEGRFIKEIAQFVSNHEEFEFHVGGFGYLEEYIINSSEKYENIFFYGRLPYKTTLALENACDIMVAVYDPQVANHKYAAPNKFYEALMLGKPIIMAKGTGMSDVISKNEIGVLIDYKYECLPEAFEKLSALMKNGELIRIKMKKLYKSDYDWSNMEKRLMNLYKQID